MKDERLKRFNEVTERHRWTIYKVCHHYGRISRVPEEDLLQEVLLELWLKLDRMTDAVNVRVEAGWVRTVAHNVAANYVKAEKSREMLRHGWHSDDAAAEDAMHLVDEMIAQLDSTDSAIMRLDLEGYSDAEIAAVTGLSAGAVSMRIHRIKNKLQEMEK